MAEENKQYDKYVLVTGSSRGIGLGFVTSYSSSPSTLVVACARSPANAEALNKLASERNNVKLVQLDVADDASINAAVATVSALVPRLDLLLNNAGQAHPRHPNDWPTNVESEIMMNLYRVNTVGPAVLTTALLPLLRAPRPSAVPARVAHVGSNLGSLANCAYASPVAYRCSKAALGMLTRCQAFEIKDVVFLVLHPGWVATDMGSSGNRRPPVKVADTVAGMVAVIEGAGIEQSGKFIDYKGEELPW